MNNQQDSNGDNYDRNTKGCCAQVASSMLKMQCSLNLPSKHVNTSMLIPCCMPSCCGAHLCVPDGVLDVVWGDDYLCMPDGVLNVVWGDGEQHVQQDALLAGVAAVAVDVDQIAAQASVHLRQTHSLQPTLMEGNVILLHHGSDCLPAQHAVQVKSAGQFDEKLDSSSI